MQFTRLNIPEIILLEPKIFSDNRGVFYESFNQDGFNDIVGRKITFVQDNHSFSLNSVLRGLHYQTPPKAQGKLVRVVSGEIFDVVVDIRKSSPTFGYWLGEVLSSENKKQLWIPEGFAHGFFTMSESAEVLYKTTDYYSPKHEKSIIWNDNDIGIKWPVDLSKKNVIISEKDLLGAPFKDAELFV